MQCVLRGQSFHLIAEDVAAAMRDVQAEPQVRYAVRIGGQFYPPRQVLARATGLPVAAFTTQDAYRIMVRLGCEVVPAEQVVGPKPPIS